MPMLWTLKYMEVSGNMELDAKNKKGCVVGEWYKDKHGFWADAYV